AVPLVVRDEALGVLAVHSRRARAFDTEQIEVLTLLASLVTPALEAAHLLESRELQVRGLTALQEVAVAASGIMDAQTLGQRTVGALAVATYKPHRYDALQAKLLNLFAAQIAPALEAARLASERERHHLVMRTLQQLGAAAGGLLDFEVISRMAIDAAVEL